MSAWTAADMPSQQGRLAIVTGASPGGLGYETALALCGAGAGMVLATRNPDRGEAARRGILARYPGADVQVAALDLARLSSVAGFAAHVAARHDRVDLLVNNAGVMALPQRRNTADGFEMQLGSNYLGHFALTGHLLPLLRAAQAPRVVNLASLAHRQGRIDFDDLQTERPYRAWKAYGQSKLAMLMFALELQRRSETQGWGLLANAAHPGYARTELIANGPASDGRSRLLSLLGAAMRPWLSHSAAAGALPTLYAATSPDAQGGAYYGPDGFHELKGAPAPAFVARQAHDRAAAARLWEVSCELTGVRF